MRPLSVLSLFFLFSTSRVLCESPAAENSWNQAVQRTESILLKECGSQCLAVLRNLLTAQELHNTTSANVGEHALHLIADHVLQQASYLERLSESASKSTQASGFKSRSKQPVVLKMKTIMADTPCNSQTLCSIDGLIANKCSYMRKGMQLAYQGLNLAVHVMGVLITVLCGCLFVFTQAKCVLFAVPPICIRPYSVYSKAFSGSVQMWESVKSMTKTCIMHGSPMISS